MKKLITMITISILMSMGFTTIGFSSNSIEEITASQVVQKMDSREDGETQTMDTLMVLINKNNKKRVRNIKNIRKDYGLDSKGIIFFLSPADVRNTAYLSYDWDDEVKEDDSWLYLPALQKVKRIASSDQSGSFMGSDFSYADINGIQINNWDYTFANPGAKSSTNPSSNKSVKVDGFDTWVIQGVPKKELKDKVLTQTGYLKSMMWIRKDNHMLIKAKYWVKEGRKIKFFKAQDISKVDDIWTAHTLTMITTAKGKKTHSSVLKFSNVNYNTPIDDETFTTRRMERGL
jgi:hypothetical protein